jgi:OOP family OmpA-OmpF porin
MNGISLPVRASQAAMILSLAACQPGDGNASNDAEVMAGPTNASLNMAAEPDLRPEPKSIIRPDVEVGAVEMRAPEPETVTIPFPAKAVAPDAAAVALIDELMSRAAFRAGGPVTIWGHSDSRGSDLQNLAASRRRAEAVRDYLMSKGVPRERMHIVALGEGRPVAPNRQLDGSEDAMGQAKNRRVEIRVDLPGKSVDEEVPSSATK